MKKNKLILFIPALLLFSMACLCTNTAGFPTAQPQEPVNPPTDIQPSTSGIIEEIILAKDTQGELLEPVDPTTVFSPSAVIHAVVSIVDAPVDTNFTAEFYVVDVGAAADSNSLIATTDLTGDGTRNLDFTLSPTASWPAGSYRVDLYVNGDFDQSVFYTVE
jgi:hypothetical protein